MLQRFYVDNFKTLINVEWRPEPITLLVGANNAGKTNLANALRFLSLTSAGEIKSMAPLVGEAWQLHNVELESKQTIDLECTAELPVDGEACRFDYSLSLKVDRPTSAADMFAVEYSVSHELLDLTTQTGDRVRLLQNTGGEVRLLHEERHFGGQPGETYIDTSCPPTATMLYRLYDLKANQRANAFKKYLWSWRYYDLNPTAMRNATPAKPADWDLYPDGSNLVSVVHTLKNVSEKDYRVLLDVMRQVEPALDAIAFFATQDQVIMWFSDTGGRMFYVRSISDGTLRFLALAYLIISRARLAEQFHTPPPLLIIEEPENGLYVGVLRELFDLIGSQGEAGQYLFTSHSPHFIDLFEERPEAVVTACRRGAHTELRKPDRDRLRKLLENMSLGELHFREMLV